MRIIIHETYEYEVEADSADEATELFDRYRENGRDLDDDIEDTGVSFNQNYLHFYDQDLNEI
jgi:hypothetical protein